MAPREAASGLPRATCGASHPDARGSVGMLAAAPDRVRTQRAGKKGVTSTPRARRPHYVRRARASKGQQFIQAHPPCGAYVNGRGGKRALASHDLALSAPRRPTLPRTPVPA